MTRFLTLKPVSYEQFNKDHTRNIMGSQLYGQRFSGSSHQRPLGDLPCTCLSALLPHHEQLVNCPIDDFRYPYEHQAMKTVLTCYPYTQSCPYR